MTANGQVPVGPGTLMTILGFAGSLAAATLGVVLILGDKNSSGETLLWSGMAGLTVNGVGALTARAWQANKSHVSPVSSPKIE